MSSNGHHAVGGPLPAGHPGTYSNIRSLSPQSAPSQHMGSSHSKSTHPIPSSAPSSSSVALKGISAAVAGGIRIKRAFATKRKKSGDATSLFATQDLQARPLPLASSSSAPLPQVLNIASRKSVGNQQPPSPPPPTPPKHDKHLPSPLHAEQSRGIPPPNRISILPISPGISPAVNYMLLQQQTPAVSTPADKPSPSLPQPQPVAKEVETQGKDPEKVKLGDTTDNMIDKTEAKETWRKSDSTNSHHTVRPGGCGGSTRTSRPVSWAESFQSTHTVVQVSSKRLSALITDADFGMPEEDDESFVSVGGSPPNSTPPLSVRVKNRRSMSLTLGAPSVSTIPVVPSANASTTELKNPSHSISEDFSSSTMNTHLTTSPTTTSPIPSWAPTSLVRVPTSTSFETEAGQQSQSSTASNIRGRFIAWTAANTNSSAENMSRLERTLPALPPQRRPSLSQRSAIASTGGGATSSSSSTAISLRQTAISMTASGLGPAAAGLAKRAVEKMGRKWGMSLSPSTSGSGSGYSSSSSSTNAPSSFSSASHVDYGLVRTSSNQSTPSVHSHVVKSSYSQGSAVGGGKRRTPDAPSGTYSVHSIASMSDNDPFASSSGPILGTQLRGGLRSKNGVSITSGVVFGKDLRTVTRETGVNVGKGMGLVGVDRGSVNEGLVLGLEGRLLPAIVVRCAQHLLIWGVQEEGLFRLSGRPFHVSKLRSEFDSGADYDMTQCSPGDLDPHAVASVFKAYLRELPESILTQALSPFFEAAIKKEASTNFSEQNRPSVVGRGNNNNPGLPQGPKGGFTLHKPPSLSTLAMPTFSGIPPPSTSLVADIKSLISRLPQENYHLLRTVVDLIKMTGKESKKTKMPLSNLLLVFCPSLNMTPPLLKVFCEEEGIWGGSESEMGADVVDSPPLPPLPMKDGQFTPAKQEEAEMTDTSDELDDDDDEIEGKSLMSSGRASLDTTDDPSSGYHASAEEEASLFEEGQVVRRRWASERGTARSEIPTVYLDTRSHYSSSSTSSLREPLESSELRHHHMDSRDGLVTADDNGSISSASHAVRLVPPTSSPSPPLCSSSAESVATPTSEPNSSFSRLPSWDDSWSDEKKVHGVRRVEIVSSGTTTTPTKKASISHPIPIDADALQFPQIMNTPSTRRAKRLSIPLLSLPDFSLSSLSSSGNVDNARDDDSPCPSPTSATSAVNMLSNRSKRPSLRLLFSRKSASSLNSLGDHSGGGSGNGIPFISHPVPQQGPYSSTWESGTSNSSSGSLSAVTAPSGMSSRSHLPPVLDTPIEDPSLSLDLRFEVSPPATAIPLTGNEGMREQQKVAKVGVSVGVASPPTTTSTNTKAEGTDPEEAPPQTPIASRSSIVSTSPPSSPVTMAPLLPLISEPPQSSLSVYQQPPLSLETHPSCSEVSISSSTPSPQLNLFDVGEEEDWTQSVLSAADRL